MIENNYFKGYEVAGFWVRLIASFIDNLILLVPLILFVVYFDINTENDSVSLMSNIIIVLFFVTLWVKWGGKTPGKALLGIKIISSKESTEDITFFQGLLRYFGYILSTIFFFIGFIIIGFRKDKRGLHDLISDTYVVYENKLF